MGGGDHGHGQGHESFKVPDWRKYKIDGIKELMITQGKLADKGLRDPWIRNEVWRYHPENYAGLWSNFRRVFFRGFPLAVGLMGVTIAVDIFFGISESRKAAVEKAIHDSHHH